MPFELFCEHACAFLLVFSSESESCVTLTAVCVPEDRRLLVFLLPFLLKV